MVLLKSSANDNVKIIKHSAMVAKAAYKIALKTKGVIDPDVAYMCGIGHDIGKLNLEKSQKYKHPLVGYQMMLENGDRTMAEVCITHPFAIYGLQEYIESYCCGDTEISRKISDVLASIPNTPLIRLIQFCDKISGVNEYMKLEDKLEWYRKTYNTDPILVNKNLEVYVKIKREMEEYIEDDLYQLVFGVNSTYKG